MARVQGEGDYESARRYNARTKRSVESTRGKAKKAEGGVDERALGKARAKSKAGNQDARDARLVRELTSGAKRRKSMTSRTSAR